MRWDEMRLFIGHKREDKCLAFIRDLCTPHTGNDISMHAGPSSP